MVRSIGIDPGDHTVKVVELDGSYRKTRLLRVHTGPVAPAGTDVAARTEAVAVAVEAALADGMRGEVRLGHPCRETVLRVIELPFRGHDAIRKVVKAEVEGEIHSHIVDDMIVDFHEVGAVADGGTRVLVASVPKAALRSQLEALRAHGIDAEKVDLDTMALWRAAHWAGAFEVAEGAPDATAKADSLPVTAVVDLGARSVKVLMVEGERLVEMRALRLGDAAVADDVARRHGLDPASAREAVRACLSTGSDQVVDVVDAVPAPLEGEAPAQESAPKHRDVRVTHAEVEAAQTAFLQRLARELARYMTSSGKASRIRALWVTGGASATPGTREMLAEVFGLPPQELDVLGRLSHDLDPATVADLGPRLTTAIGLALGKFGGPVGFDLRQEDLVLTRGFERVKFPLAIACMVGWLALFVYGNRRSIELKNLELQIGSTYIDRSKPKAPPLFHGMLNSVFRSKWFENPQQFRFEQAKGKDFTYKDLLAEIVAAPVHRRLLIVRDRLKQVADQKQKESGVYEDVSLESGLAVLVRFAEVLGSVESQLGRYLVPRLELNMKAPNRRLEFSVAFRGDDFRDRLNTLQQAIDAEYGKPDSPFERGKGRDEGAKEELFRDSAESNVRGAYYKIQIRVKDTFEPFGPSNPTAVGAVSPEPGAGAEKLAALGGGR